MTEKGKPISDENVVFYEYGKKVLVQSIDILKDYIKLMIPLTTGLITSFLALLNFMGKHFSNINKDIILILGPIILLISLLSFIVASFPIRTRLTLSNITSIKKYQKDAIAFKYTGAIIGSILFIIGLLLMIYIMLT